MIRCPPPLSTLITSPSFKSHLKFVEAGFTAPATTKLESYLSGSDRKYSVIYHFNSDSTINTCHYNIDDGSPLEDVDEFIDVTTSQDKEFGRDQVVVIVDTCDVREHVISKLTRNLEGRCYREEHSLFDHYKFIRPKEHSSTSMRLMDGYKVVRLCDTHVKQISEQWKCDLDSPYCDTNPTHDITLEPEYGTVLDNVTNRPGYGVKAGEVLVGWCTAYNTGGEIGMLHVVPTHRGRGLARHLVQALALTLQQQLGSDLEVSACTHKHNAAAQEFFLSEGWQKQEYNSIKIFWSKGYLERLGKW